MTSRDATRESQHSEAYRRAQEIAAYADGAVAPMPACYSWVSVMLARALLARSTAAVASEPKGPFPLPPDAEKAVRELAEVDRALKEVIGEWPVYIEHTEQDGEPAKDALTRAGAILLCLQRIAPFSIGRSWIDARLAWIEGAAKMGKPVSRDEQAAFVDGWKSCEAALSAIGGMSDDLPLRCAAEGGILDMRIGEKVLAFATENCPAFYDAERDCGRFKVTDPGVFVKEVARALNDEAEDGSTMLSRLLDKAIEEAIEQGAEGVEEIPPTSTRSDIK